MNSFGVWTSLVEAIIAYVLMRRLAHDKEGVFQWRMRPFAVVWFYSVMLCSFFNMITAMYWGERTFEKVRSFFRSLCFLVSEVGFACLIAQILMDYGYYSLFRVALLSMVCPFLTFLWPAYWIGSQWMGELMAFCGLYGMAILGMCKDNRHLWNAAVAMGFGLVMFSAKGDVPRTEIYSLLIDYANFQWYWAMIQVAPPPEVIEEVEPNT